MKIRYIYIVVFLVGGLRFLSSCKKFVQVPPPQSLLVSSEVFKNSGAATSALTTIYSQMFNDLVSYRIAQSTGYSGDELFNYSSGVLQTQTYKNALSPLTDDAGIWKYAYNYIYEANAVSEGLETSSLSLAIKNQLSGKALFIRAFWHFYLVNIYGDIPLMTSTDYEKNGQAFRQTVSKVYDQIINDLIAARSKLNPNYIGASDTAVTTDRYRPNRFCADALLARVYLYNKDYPNAEREAGIVIDSSGSGFYSIEQDPNNAFLISSKEVLWRLQSVVNSVNSNDGQYFILNSTPSGSGFLNCSTISSFLFNSFSASDKRMSNWISSVVVGTDTYHFPFKYKVVLNSSITENTAVFRLAEQYLIRAEARAKQNKNDLAVDDINVIRNRAGIGDYTFDTNDKLLSEILQQRQLELFTEWGHRWFDLKRTGNINAVMDTVCPAKGGTWSPNWTLYPIPQTERDLDHNLTQNDGY